MAKKCKDEGAEIVVVHGETLMEPVEEKTNYYASLCEDVDILAHPGLIDETTAKNVKENNIFLEITTRKGHGLTNGHVANIANKFNIPTLINTDCHSPSDLINYDFGLKVGLGCNLGMENTLKSLTDYPKELLKRI